MRRLHKIGQILSIVSLLSVASVFGAVDQTSYSFSLREVSGDTIYFEGDDGSPWDSVSFGCDGCSFLLTADGVRGSAVSTDEPSHAAVRFRLANDGGSLEVTCLARKCKVQSTTMSGKLKNRKIRRGRTKRIVASVGTRFQVID